MGTADYELGKDVPFVIVPLAILLDDKLSDAAKIGLMVLHYFDFSDIKKDDDGKLYSTSKGFTTIGKPALRELMHVSDTKLKRTHAEMAEHGWLKRPSGRSTKRVLYLPDLKEKSKVVNDALFNMRNKYRDEPLDENELQAAQKQAAKKILSGSNRQEKAAKKTLSGSNRQKEAAQKQAPNYIQDNNIQDYNTTTSSEISEDSSKKLLGFKIPSGSSTYPNKAVNPKLRKKIEAGEWDRISDRELINYYKEQYRLKYDQLHGPTNQSLESVIKKSFFNKHTRKECVHIIDDLFAKYDTLAINHNRYPTPMIRVLTQAWLLAKLKDPGPNDYGNGSEEEAEDSKKYIEEFEAQMLLPKLDEESRAFIESIKRSDRDTYNHIKMLDNSLKLPSSVLQLIISRDLEDLALTVNTIYNKMLA